MTNYLIFGCLIFIAVAPSLPLAEQTLRQVAEHTHYLLLDSTYCTYFYFTGSNLNIICLADLVVATPLHHGAYCLLLTADYRLVTANNLRLTARYLPRTTYCLLLAAYSLLLLNTYYLLVATEY